MTPRESLLAALKLESPSGAPPHLELVYQIFEQWPGVPWLQPQHLAEVGESRRREMLKQFAATLIQCAEEFHWSLIVSFHHLELDDQCLIMQYLRELSGDTYMLPAFVDGTCAIPNGAGMYEFTMRIADEPHAVLEEADRRVDEALARIKTLADAGAEIVFMCSDYCFNSGPFLSPTMFSQFVTPFLRRQVEGIHELGLYAVKHTDGQIMPILDQLVDTGIDGLHSLDPMAGVDIAEVKRLVGDRVCLLGNVDCSAVQAGTFEQVRDSALYCLQYGGAATGGYVYCTSNCIFRGVPLENYRYLLRLWQEFEPH